MMRRMRPYDSISSDETTDDDPFPTRINTSTRRVLDLSFNLGHFAFTFAFPVLQYKESTQRSSHHKRYTTFKMSRPKVLLLAYLCAVALSFYGVTANEVESANGENVDDKPVTVAADPEQKLDTTTESQPAPVPVSVKSETRTGKQSSAFFPSESRSQSSSDVQLQELASEASRLPVAMAKDDTYNIAAKDFSYGYPSQSQSQGYVPYPLHHGSGSSSGGYGSYYPAPSSSYGEDAGFDLDNFGHAGIGGLGGFLGLLGLKGLKGLGVIGLFKALAIPAFLFILPVLLILPILLLFLPIPLITVGNGNGKKMTGPATIFGYTLPDINGKLSTLSRAVMESENCVERVSCEVSRYGRGTIIDRTLKRIISHFESIMPHPLARMARAYMGAMGGSCKPYRCYLMDDGHGSGSAANQFQKKN